MSLVLIWTTEMGMLLQRREMLQEERVDGWWGRMRGQVDVPGDI